MPQGFTPIIFSLYAIVISVAFSVELNAQPQPVDVSNVEFGYPMTVIDSAELEIVRARIKAGIEPQKTAYEQLLRDAKHALDFTPAPPAHMKIMGGYAIHSNLNEVRALLEREAEAAYATALAWLYSGEEAYALKSVEILDAWAAAGTSFSGGDRGLQLGSWFNRMLYAADIMRGYDGWSDARRTTFEQWWRREVLVHVREVMKDYANNWKDAGVLGVLTAAVVFEDRELLGEGLAELNSYFYPRTDVGVVATLATEAGLPGRGLLKMGLAKLSLNDAPETQKGSEWGADWKLKMDKRGVYFPREVTRNGGASGVMYTAYTLTSLVQAMEIARYAGFDWWQRKTKNGASLEQAIACYFRWNELKEPFAWHESPRRSPMRKNPFEIANNHFPDKIDGLKAWLEANRPVNGRQGDPYVTLNHAEIPPR